MAVREGSPGSAMTHTFSRAPQADIPRSMFDRTHGYKTTFDSGLLIPIFLDEALPGDTFTARLHAFSRLATPIFPLMDNLYMDTFFFAVPKRLVWENFQKFNGEQDNPGDSTDYVIPQVSPPAGGYPELSLGDYFGLPTKVEGFSVSALPFRAHNLIWNEWFRDQNLQQSLPVPKDDGPDDESNYKLQRRAKRYDYFTSCLPWPQKGPAVELPLGDMAPVIGAGDSNPIMNQGKMRQTGDQIIKVETNATGDVTWVDPKLQVNLDDATAATINQLRQAFQVQKMLERDARGGTRYTEIVRSHFGVISPDARLQRPEYLGGGSTPVHISPIAQTSETGATTPQGNLAAYGTVNLSGHGFSKSFTEHCYVIGYVMVRADLNYQQGIDRMWSRRTRYDFYWPALSHIGEQAVLSQEIYADGTASDQDVFGYQERYAEYRYKPSKITGRFRSNATQKLDAWHLAQDFDSRPLLNDTFIQENPPVDRIKAVPTEPHFLFDSVISYRCGRPMPLYSVPGLIDHF